MMLWLFVSLLLPTFAEERFCEELLNPTLELTLYLQTLSQEGLLTIENLENLRDQLETNQEISLEFSLEEKVSLTSAQVIHSEGLKRYSFHPDLNKDLVLQWIQSQLLEMRSRSDHRQKVKKETRVPFQRIVFYPLSTPKLRADWNAPVIEHDFEMTPTPITQAQWFEAMGTNPSHWSNGEISEVNSQGLLVPLRPHNPMEMVSWWSAIYFANALSIRRGLTPAYRLDHLITLEDSNPAQGNWSVDDKNLLERHIVNHPSGDILQTEGYRLPTEREMLFVLHWAAKHRQMHENLGYNWPAEILKELFWIDTNSAGQSHLVGEKPPLVVNGFPVDDFLGNVSEWLQDIHGKADFPARENSLALITRKVHQGSYGENIFIIQKQVGSNNGPGFPRRDLGFRLVRTIK